MMNRRSMSAALASNSSSNRLSTPVELNGYVDWELINDKTGKVVKRGVGKTQRWYYNYLPLWIQNRLPLGTRNAIVNKGREELAQVMIGASPNLANFIAVGTGTTAVTASDTALATLSQYDGANDAKVTTSRSLKDLFTARLVTQFGTAEANVNIREVGLFGLANAGNMWARALITVNKTSSERLNIYWYFIFSRRTDLAIKTGASIGATGTLVQDNDSTLTFASAVTVITLHNKSGGIVYISLSDAMTGTPPDDYDFLMADGASLSFLAEEFQQTIIHTYNLAGGSIVMPDNAFVARGW